MQNDKLSLNPKVVVFGGSGFLGSHVADALSNAGYRVVVFDCRQSLYLNATQEMRVGNILNFEHVVETIKGCDYVYNFAGIADLDNAATKPIDTVKFNIEGVVNILDACRQEKIKHFVYASSVYVYSNKGGFYRCSKQAAELYIEEFHNRYGLNYTILRYGTLYGPRADERNSVHRYMKQALDQSKITVIGNGEELREYINVRDAAELSVKILAPEFKDKHFIITGHHPIKVNQLIATIKEILNNTIDVLYIPGGNDTHYSITPYSYVPKAGKKLTVDCYTDIGQGLLECIYEISNTKNTNGS